MSLTQDILSWPVMCVILMWIARFTKGCEDSVVSVKVAPEGRVYHRSGEVQIKCVLEKGVKHKSIEWFKADGDEPAEKIDVETSGNLKINVNGTLVISTFTSLDEGVYHC